MAKEVVVTADKINRRKKAFLTAKVLFLFLLILLFVIFVVLSLMFRINSFTISLDSDLQNDKGIVLYEDLDDKASQRKLFAETVDNMDNISVDWIDKDVHTGSSGGSHNGDNYIAYTFYIENQGTETINYWYNISIDDVIKDVDEAIRVKLYLNDNNWLYAKKNSETMEAEEGTIPFYKDDVVVLQSRDDFKVGEIDKFTVVIFIEGNDPDCVNNIIGGEIKMHMEIRQERLEEE